MKLRRWKVLLPLAAVALGYSNYLGRQSYVPPNRANLRLRLNYLEHVVEAGDAPDTPLGKLYRQNPEWALFTLSFSTYALTNLAAQDSSYRAEAATYVAQAIALARAASLRQAFAAGPVAVGAAIDTSNSVLYLGHLNLMLGCHRQLVPNSPFRYLHDTLSAALFRRYGEAASGNLASYPHLRWLPDNTVALASLALHSGLTGSPYDEAGRRWVARAQADWLDPATGLLASQVDAQGRVAEEPRGSMLGWSIWFAARFDSAFARQQYRRYQATASTSLGGWRCYRERPGHYATGVGDVDSGPLLLGYSIPATAFAFADAVALRDYRHAQQLRRVINLGSREIVENNELRYGVRLVDLEVSPLSEALLLWADVPGQ